MAATETEANDFGALSSQRKQCICCECYCYTDTSEDDIKTSNVPEKRRKCCCCCDCECRYPDDYILYIIEKYLLRAKSIKDHKAETQRLIKKYYGEGEEESPERRLEDIILEEVSKRSLKDESMKKKKSLTLLSEKSGTSSRETGKSARAKRQKMLTELASQEKRHEEHRERSKDSTVVKKTDKKEKGKKAKEKRKQGEVTESSSKSLSSSTIKKSTSISSKSKKKKKATAEEQSKESEGISSSKRSKSSTRKGSKSSTSKRSKSSTRKGSKSSTSKRSKSSTRKGLKSEEELKKKKRTAEEKSKESEGISSSKRSKSSTRKGSKSEEELKRKKTAEEKSKESAGISSSKSSKSSTEERKIIESILESFGTEAQQRKLQKREEEEALEESAEKPVFETVEDMTITVDESDDESRESDKGLDSEEKKMKREKRRAARRRVREAEPIAHRINRKKEAARLAAEEEVKRVEEAREAEEERIKQEKQRKREQIIEEKKRKLQLQMEISRQRLREELDEEKRRKAAMSSGEREERKKEKQREKDKDWLALAALLKADVISKSTANQMDNVLEKLMKHDTVFSDSLSEDVAALAGFGGRKEKKRKKKHEEIVEEVEKEKIKVIKKAKTEEKKKAKGGKIEKGEPPEEEHDSGEMKRAIKKQRTVQRLESLKDAKQELLADFEKVQSKDEESDEIEKEQKSALREIYEVLQLYDTESLVKELLSESLVDEYEYMSGEDEVSLAACLAYSVETPKEYPLILGEKCIDTYDKFYEPIIDSMGRKDFYKPDEQFKVDDEGRMWNKLGVRSKSKIARKAKKDEKSPQGRFSKSAKEWPDIGADKLPQSVKEMKDFVHATVKKDGPRLSGKKAVDIYKKSYKTFAESIDSQISYDIEEILNVDTVGKVWKEEMQKVRKSLAPQKRSTKMFKTNKVFAKQPDDAEMAGYDGEKLAKLYNKMLDFSGEIKKQFPQIPEQQSIGIYKKFYTRITRGDNMVDDVPVGISYDWKKLPQIDEEKISFIHEAVGASHARMEDEQVLAIYKKSLISFIPNMDRENRYTVAEIQQADIIGKLWKKEHGEPRKNYKQEKVTSKSASKVSVGGSGMIAGHDAEKLEKLYDKMLAFTDKTTAQFSQIPEQQCIDIYKKIYTAITPADAKKDTKVSYEWNKLPKAGKEIIDFINETTQTGHSSLPEKQAINLYRKSVKSFLEKFDSKCAYTIDEIQQADKIGKLWKESKKYDKKRMADLYVKMKAFVHKTRRSFPELSEQQCIDVYKSFHATKIREEEHRRQGGKKGCYACMRKEALSAVETKKVDGRQKVPASPKKKTMEDYDWENLPKSCTNMMFFLARFVVSIDVEVHRNFTGFVFGEEASQSTLIVIERLLLTAVKVASREARYVMMADKEAIDRHRRNGVLIGRDHLEKKSLLLAKKRTIGRGFFYGSEHLIDKASQALCFVNIGNHVRLLSRDEKLYRLPVVYETLKNYSLSILKTLNTLIEERYKTRSIMEVSESPNFTKPPIRKVKKESDASLKAKKEPQESPKSLSRERSQNEKHDLESAAPEEVERTKEEVKDGEFKEPVYKYRTKNTKKKEHSRSKNMIENEELHRNYQHSFSISRKKKMDRGVENQKKTSSTLSEFSSIVDEIENYKSKLLEFETSSDGRQKIRDMKADQLPVKQSNFHAVQNCDEDSKQADNRRVVFCDELPHHNSDVAKDNDYGKVGQPPVGQVNLHAVQTCDIEMTEINEHEKQEVGNYLLRPPGTSSVLTSVTIDGDAGDPACIKEKNTTKDEAGNDSNLAPLTKMNQWLAKNNRNSNNSSFSKKNKNTNNKGSVDFSTLGNESQGYEFPEELLTTEPTAQSVQPVAADGSFVERLIQGPKLSSVKEFRYSRHASHNYIVREPNRLGSGIGFRLLVRLPFLGNMTNFKEAMLRYKDLEFSMFDTHNKDRVLFIIQNKSSIHRSEAATLIDTLKRVYSVAWFEAACEKCNPRFLKERTLTAEPLKFLHGMIAEERTRIKRDTQLSYSHKYLNADLVKTFSSKETRFGGQFSHCVRHNAYHPEAKFPRATDPDAYVTFAAFFDPIIKDYNQYDPVKRSGISSRKKKLPSPPFQNFIHPNVLTYRVRYARNLKGFGFPPTLTATMRRIIEMKLKSKLLLFCKTNAGAYFTLSDVKNTRPTFANLLYRPDETNPKERHKVNVYEIMTRSKPISNTCGVYRNWPHSRGVMLLQLPESELGALIWINHEDHFRLESIDPTGQDISSPFSVCRKILKKLQCSFPNLFERSHRYGFLTFCPSEVGHGMRVSARVRLPRLAGRKKMLKQICDSMELQFRGYDGEHTKISDSIYDVSFKARLGRTERESVEDFTEYLRVLIQCDESLIQV